MAHHDCERDLKAGRLTELLMAWPWARPFGLPDAMTDGRLLSFEIPEAEVHFLSLNPQESYGSLSRYQSDEATHLLDTRRVCSAESSRYCQVEHCRFSTYVQECSMQR
jgi:hypothetical protein